MKLNVLTVDWDYFFPCIDYFDWGHSESESFAIFAETLWQIRAAQPVRVTFPPVEKLKNDKRTIFEYAQARSEEVKTFWRDTIKYSPARFLATETHLDMWQVFQGSEDKLNVWNFDAHHDAGYNGGKHPNCGNWAKFLHDKNIMQEYNLYYPEWRRVDPEKAAPPDWARVNYGIPNDLPVIFHYILVCRSSAWTPSWCDPEWLEFIDERQFVGSKYFSVEYVTDARAFDMDASIADRKQMEDYMEAIENEQKIST